MQEAEQRERYQRAVKRVREIRGFYTHFLVYLAVNIGLFLMDHFTGNVGWHMFALIGWGIGVAVHGVSVLTRVGPFGPEWEQRKIQQYLREEGAGEDEVRAAAGRPMPEEAEPPLDNPRAEAARMARKRAEDIRGWFTHVLVFALVAAFFFFLDYRHDHYLDWFYWPIMFWGFAVLIHTGTVWIGEGLMGPRWEKRMVRKYMDEMSPSDRE